MRTHSTSPLEAAQIWLNRYFAAIQHKSEGAVQKEKASLSSQLCEMGLSHMNNLRHRGIPESELVESVLTDFAFIISQAQVPISNVREILRQYLESKSSLVWRARSVKDSDAQEPFMSSDEGAMGETRAEFVNRARLHAEALLNQWVTDNVQGKQAEDRRLFTKGLTFEGRSMARQNLWRDWLERLTRKRLEVYTTVARENATWEMFSADALEQLRAKALRTIRQGVLCLRGEIGIDYRTCGTGNPLAFEAILKRFPEAEDSPPHSGIEAQLLGVVNAGIRVMESEGRLKLAGMAQSSGSVVSSPLFDRSTNPEPKNSELKESPVSASLEDIRRALDSADAAESQDNRAECAKYRKLAVEYWCLRNRAKMKDLWTAAKYKCPKLLQMWKRAEVDKGSTSDRNFRRELLKA